MLKAKEFCMEYKDFIKAGFQVENNIKTFIGDLLYLYDKYFNVDIQNHFDYDKIIRTIYKETLSKSYGFKKVGVKSINRYKFLKSLDKLLI